MEGDGPFISEITRWMYSFTTEIESEYEEQDSLDKLKSFIESSRNNEDISAAAIDFTHAFVTASFEHNLSMISKRNFSQCWNHWVSENGFTESSNRSLLYDPLGPKPNDSIHIACDKTLAHTK